MGNSPLNKESSDPSTEYYQLLADSNVTGTTWEELAANLQKHIESGSISNEWEKLGQKDAERSDAEDLFLAARVPHNVEKNRYINILPFDSTRVKLTVMEGIRGSDYINANFVHIGERSYICCQAPMENTLADFHRMLWETNTSVIVMLTKFVESGKIKAHEYFPAYGKGTMKYGDIEVEVTSEENVNDIYVIRKFSLSKATEKREVTQYHFLAWPDHGVPDEPLPLSEMIDQVNKLQREVGLSTPAVVHCSAGIGRTGTYVIVNTILEHITECMKVDPLNPPSINLMKTLHQLRGMRSGMVTHKDQYEFCYKTILAHIQKLIEDQNQDQKTEVPHQPEEKKEDDQTSEPKA